jgi:hypothetical protein
VADYSERIGLISLAWQVAAGLEQSGIVLLFASVFASSSIHRDASIQGADVMRRVSPTLGS